MTQRGRLRQRADFTQKFNLRAGRHGWLRLTPAYSVKVVDQILKSISPKKTVLDPFCGTGTTAVCAASRGHCATTVDINPFLVWFARTKAMEYSNDLLNETDAVSRKVVKRAMKRSIEPVPEPPIFRIDRWWSESVRDFLRHLKAAIDLASAPSSPLRDLLYVAFCRTLMNLSFAAFNHQSISFNGSRQTQLKLEIPYDDVFLDAVRTILVGARENPKGQASVIHGDSRKLKSVIQSKFDIVITSPPYANRMSYIRELRPYMYWLGYLQNGREAGELDWKAIGGTWGIATSRLNGWNRNSDCWLPKSIGELVQEISRSENANGVLLANYVSKYCHDMSCHFRDLRSVLRAGGQFHYIVGNSTFYGVLVPIEEVYAELLRHYGFRAIKITPIRKRNSNKKLIEFDVSGSAPRSRSISSNSSNRRLNSP